jgi:hypothetical protein
MELAPDTPHSKYPHVYPIVRIDTPIDQTDPTQRITVVKVLTSQSGAEAEVSRLSQVNADKSCLYFYCASRLIEQVSECKRDFSPVTSSLLYPGRRSGES